MHPILSVFMKFPSPGKVKTRLAATLGQTAATLAYEELAATTLSNLPYPDAQLHIHYDPPHAQLAIGNWLRGNVPECHWRRLIPQAEGGLGDRLWSAVQQAFHDQTPPSVTLIGTDCPYIKPWHFRRAWAALDNGADVVYGPAVDGGYYLVAMKQPHPELFHDIPWSTDQTLATSLARCEEVQLQVHLLETLADVDEAAEYHTWLRERE